MLSGNTVSVKFSEPSTRINKKQPNKATVELNNLAVDLNLSRPQLKKVTVCPNKADK